MEVDALRRRGQFGAERFAFACSLQWYLFAILADFSLRFDRMFAVLLEACSTEIVLFDLGVIHEAPSVVLVD